MLNSAPLFVCRARCPVQFQRGVNCTEFRLIRYLRTLQNPPHWQTMRTQTIFDLTSSSLLAWGFHKLMMHFDFDTEGFSVRMWSSDERRDGFFSTQLSLIKQCNKKWQFSLCISHKSFTWPLITLPFYETMTVKPMRDWNAPGAWCVLFRVLRM